MRVTKQMLSVPPYLATAWEHVAALRVEGGVLIVKMMDGTHAEVPGLSGEQLQEIFAAHAAHLESQSQPVMPFHMMPGGIEGLQGHDAANSDAPDLPEEVLSKIGQITRVIGVDLEANAPDPVDGCNCFHCQIASVLKGKPEALPEEEVSEEDLQFCNWDISGDEKIYTVTSRLNRSESYQVCLDPVGCTCGDTHCEHIRAVLES